MMSDASEMLAAALEQMDGIIAGNHIWTFKPGFSSSLSGHGIIEGLATSGSYKRQAGNTKSRGW